MIFGTREKQLLKKWEKEKRSSHEITMNKDNTSQVTSVCVGWWVLLLLYVGVVK
jgi:hypothetical protein